MQWCDNGGLGHMMEALWVVGGSCAGTVVVVCVVYFGGSCDGGVGL